MAKKLQKKNNIPDQNFYDASYGKLPPQDAEIEEAIIGAAMMEPDSFITVVKILREDSFYREAHQMIYIAMLKLHNDGSPVDILSVTGELKKQGNLETVGGPYYITKLTHRIASAANIEFWCFKIEEFAIQRRMIRICAQTIKDCYESTADVFGIVDTHQKLIDSGAVFLPGKAPDAKYRTESTMKIIDEAMSSPDKMMGATLGIPVLDDITCGFMGGDVIVIAGRPGMGKTAMVLNTLYKSNKRVALFELEMSEYQVTNREFAMFTGLPTEQIKLGRLNREEYEALLGARTYIDAQNHLIDTSPNLDIAKLRAKLYDYIHKHGTEMAVIDYLQLMNIEEEDKYSNYALAVGKVTRAIKLMAKQFNIPIIVLSQLNRAVESRGEKMPQLSDLRDSGAIEQDADCVIFLYRESYYNPDAVSDSGESMRNTIKFIVAKNRQGRLGPVETGYDPATNNFGDEFRNPSAKHSFYKL